MQENTKSWLVCILSIISIFWIGGFYLLSSHFMGTVWSDVFIGAASLPLIILAFTFWTVIFRAK